MVPTVNDLKALVFPNIAENFKKPEWLCERAIFSLRTDAVDQINLDLVQLLPRQPESLRSIDTVLDQEQVMQFPTEFFFFNSLQLDGMPRYNLILKKGAPILLLWNLDSARLCSGTRLVIKSLKPYVLWRPPSSREATRVKSSSFP